MVRSDCLVESVMDETLKRSATRVVGIGDEEMDYQLLRQLGSTRYGGASIGECLALARSVHSGDPQSWVQAFAAAAARQEQDALRRADRGHAISAHDQLLVACNSYRAAEYYSPVDAPEHAEFGRKSRDCFVAAMRLQRRYDFDELSVSLDGARLPAYVICPAGDPVSGKVLMIISGYDGTLEESFLAQGRAALERDYIVVLFAGPGQMDTLRDGGVPSLIPEYERVGAVVLDQLLALPGVDPQRVALMGISFGGYFATRIAAHDPRVQALIANSPIVDLHAYMSAFVGFDPVQMPDSEDFRIAEIDEIPEEAMTSQQREMSRNLMLRFGGRSFKETFAFMREFSVAPDDLARIACPALALMGDAEGSEPRNQFDHFRATVSGKVDSHVFTEREGADGHCQPGNLSYAAAVALDWLDEAFG